MPPQPGTGSLKKSEQASSMGLTALALDSNEPILTPPYPVLSPGSKCYRTGRWTADEHDLFLVLHRDLGRDWKAIAQLIPRRSTKQVRTHAQKYDAALERAGSKKMRVLPRQQPRTGGNKHRRTRSSSKEEDDDDEEFVHDSRAEDYVRSSDSGTSSERTDMLLNTFTGEPLQSLELGEDDIGFLFSSWMDEVATDEATTNRSSAGSSPSGLFLPTASAGG
jgi:SHAQKYF class myb-like DNA-binding protein